VPYLLINPAPDLAGHVVTFDRWTDTTMTSYEGFERSGDSGTHHRVIPYPYFGDYVLNPYRWSNENDYIGCSYLPGSDLGGVLRQHWRAGLGSK